MECKHEIDWYSNRYEGFKSAPCECGRTVINDTPEMQAEIKIEEAYRALMAKREDRWPKARVRIFKIEKDISDDIEIKNMKSDTFGWSQSEIHYEGEQIGWIESGGFDMSDGFIHIEAKDKV